MFSNVYIPQLANYQDILLSQHTRSKIIDLTGPVNAFK